MLPGVYITDADGNIGTVSTNAEDVCGILFDVSQQSGFSPEKFNVGDVLEMTNPKDLETYGIAAYDESAVSHDFLLNLAHYHISQFFAKRGGMGRLFVMFANCSANWDALETMQRYAHGLIYQVAVWTEQNLWSLNDASASVYSLNVIADINSKCKAIANEMHAPISVLLYPNTTKVKLGSGVSGAGLDTPVYNKIPTVKGDNRYVSVMLGESNADAVKAIQDGLESKTCVGAAGIDLATISLATVPECIGHVGLYDYSDYIPGILFGWGDDKTKYENVSTVTLNDLNDKGYNFFVKYEGDEVGVYRNFDHTCTDGDYRTIARNRTIGKVRRNVRAALLPKVNQTVLIDPQSGFMTSAAQADFINAVTDVLDSMVAAGEISGHSVPQLNQPASLLQTDAVYISFTVIPVGIASQIFVTEGLSITA